MYKYIYVCHVFICIYRLVCVKTKKELIFKQKPLWLLSYQRVLLKIDYIAMLMQSITVV